MNIHHQGNWSFIQTTYGLVAFDSATRQIVLRDANGQPYPEAIKEAIVDVAVQMANAELQEE